MRLVQVITREANGTKTGSRARDTQVKKFQNKTGVEELSVQTNNQTQNTNFENVHKVIMSSLDASWKVSCEMCNPPLPLICLVMRLKTPGWAFSCRYNLLCLELLFFLFYCK